MTRFFLLFFWGVFFCSNVFASAYLCNLSIRVNNNEQTHLFGLSHSVVFAPTAACLPHVAEVVTINPIQGGGYTSCTLTDGTVDISCPTIGVNTSIVYTSNTAFPSAEPTKSCKQSAGDPYGTFKTASAFCADFGQTTGGDNPQPLYCMTDPVVTDANGDTLHYLTSTSCSQPDAPEDPDPDPTPDPDPDPTPDPDPAPDTGSPGGTTPPTSGTTGSATGTIGDQAVSLNQDFKPVTERLDLLRADAVAQTKYLADKIDRTTQAVTLGTGELLKLNVKADATNAKLDTLNTSITTGTAEIGGKLDNVNSNLGDVKSSLDALNDSLNPDQDGGAIGEQVALPDYDYAVTNGVAQIQAEVDQYTVQTGLSQFSDPNNLDSIFTGAQSISDVFEISNRNCSSIPIGTQAELDLCPYAPTISSVLEILIWGLTGIFVFVYISTLLARDRL